VERFNFRKLNELKFRKQYKIKITNWFPALENLSDEEDINRAWENTKENIKISAKDSLGLYEWKKHKPWFDEECLIKGSRLKCSGCRMQTKAKAM
jgi:hypothetical protein